MALLTLGCRPDMLDFSKHTPLDVLKLTDGDKQVKDNIRRMIKASICM